MNGVTLEQTDIILGPHQPPPGTAAAAHQSSYDNGDDGLSLFSSIHPHHQLTSVSTHQVSCEN